MAEMHNYQVAALSLAMTKFEFGLRILLKFKTTTVNGKV
jgi:hypothetical protein